MLLAPEPVTLLPGIGPAMARKLAACGITRIGQLQSLPPREAKRLFGDEGPYLVERAKGNDTRVVHVDREAKSVSAEMTFETDVSHPEQREKYLWLLCEKLGRRLRAQQVAAGGVVLKLKTAAFLQRTRSTRLPFPTVLPDTLFDTARQLLAPEADGTTAFRLIGIGAAPLSPPEDADQLDLANPRGTRGTAAQGAIDALRQRFGDKIIGKGRGL
jgi:DNA polymerase-4